MKSHSKFWLAPIAATLAIVGYVVVEDSRQPSTPFERFALSTGYVVPLDAKIIEQADEYSPGMPERFASEGTRVLVFETNPIEIRTILDNKPPWNLAWKRGSVPRSVNERRPTGNDLNISQTGDAGDGKMIVIDEENSQIWYYQWNW